MNTQLLERIDMIQEASIDAELNVLCQMADSYMKAITILENYDGDDTSAFAIFQEADNFEKGLDKQANSILAQAKGKPDESLIKRILLFIPRLIKAIISKITSSDRIFKKRINNLEKEIKNKMNNKSSGSKGDTTELKRAPASPKEISMKGGYVEPDWYKGGASHNPPDMEIKLIFGATEFSEYGLHAGKVWKELDLWYKGGNHHLDIDSIEAYLDSDVRNATINTYSPDQLEGAFDKFADYWTEYEKEFEKKTKNISSLISKMRENKKTMKFDSWDQSLELLSQYTKYWGRMTDMKRWAKKIEKISSMMTDLPQKFIENARKTADRLNKHGKDGGEIVKDAEAFDFTTYEPYQTALKTTLNLCSLCKEIISQLEMAYKEDLDTIEKFVKGGYQSSWQRKKNLLLMNSLIPCPMK